MSIRGEQTEAQATLTGAEVQALANGSGALSSIVYDNRDSSGKGWLLGNFSLTATWVAMPTNDSSFELYVLYDFGSGYGTNTPGASPVVDNNSQKVVFDVKGQTGLQTINFEGVPLLPYQFKLFVINNSGAVTPADTVVKFSPSGEK